MNQYVKILLTFFLLGITPISSNAIILTQQDVQNPQKLTTQHSKQNKLLSYFLKKRFEQSKEGRKRVLKIGFWIVAGLAAIYLLQSTLWLALLSIFTLGIIFRKKIFKNNKEYEEKTYVNKDGEEITTYVKSSRGSSSSRLSYSRKSVRFFFSWLGSFILSIISLGLLIAAQSESTALILLFFGVGIAALVFLILAIVNAIKSIKNNEENRVVAIVILVLSLLFILSTLSPFLIAIIGF
jgi:hypothetical protein